MTTTTHISPAGSHKIAMKNGGATFYTYDDQKGRPCVWIYYGKSKKPKRFYFSSEARRSAHIENVIAQVNEIYNETQKRRTERNQPHTLGKGLILYTSWGYDQTNTEFYQVIDVPSACYVVLQEVGAPLVRGEESFMSGNRFPDPEIKKGEPFRRKVDMTGGKPSVKIDNVCSAWVWDGKERGVSWYA